MAGRFEAFRTRLGSAPRSLAPPPEAGAQPPALIVGLGNPGDRYRATRHNVGAWCIALLATRHGVALRQQDRVDIAPINVQGHGVHIAQPRAFVNESGPAVAAALRRLGLTRDRLLVVYDDLDLPVGQLRIRPHGGHGGHNGMRSIIEAVGGGEFPRVRIGIDRAYVNDVPVRDPDGVAAWVLSAPSREQRTQIDLALTTAADAIECAVTEGIERAMSRYNPPA